MKLLLLLALLPLIAFAQNTQPVSTPQPYCQISTSLPALGATVAPYNSVPLDNRRTGCTSFTLTVEVPTTISALSLVVQTAPDNGSPSCGTCTWSTFAAATGSNPNTVTTGWNATFTTGTSAYYAYIRIQLTSKTGTGQVNAKLQSSIAAGSGGGGGGGGSGCVGTSGTPCVVVGLGTAGTPAGGVLSIQGVSGGTSQNVTQIGNAAVISNQQAVTGTAAALATNAAKNACVKALIGNSLNVYVGPTGVTTATGMELAPGDAVCLPVSNTNLLFVIASTTGASISFIGTN